MRIHHVSSSRTKDFIKNQRARSLLQEGCTTLKKTKKNSKESQRSTREPLPIPSKNKLSLLSLALKEKPTFYLSSFGLLLPLSSLLFLALFLFFLPKQSPLLKRAVLPFSKTKGPWSLPFHLSLCPKSSLLVHSLKFLPCLP